MIYSAHPLDLSTLSSRCISSYFGKCWWERQEKEQNKNKSSTPLQSPESASPPAETPTAVDGDAPESPWALRMTTGSTLSQASAREFGTQEEKSLLVYMTICQLLGYVAPPILLANLHLLQNLYHCKT